MKIKKELLSPEEKTILADFVNSEYWPVYRKVQMNAQTNIEKLALTAEDMDKLNFYRGQAYQIQSQLADFTRNFARVDAAKKKEKIKENKK